MSYSQTDKANAIGYELDPRFGLVERNYIDSVFQPGKFKIYLAKLRPYCSDSANCWTESIIIEQFNWDTEIEDPTFGDEYFIGVSERYIDTSRTTEVELIDHSFLMTELLGVERKLEDNEVITICYNPRHAIIYRDLNNKIIAVHEVCFECGNTKVAIHTTHLRYNSSSQLKSIFKKYQLY